jgi:hypothetical protein
MKGPNENSEMTWVRFITVAVRLVSQLVGRRHLQLTSMVGVFSTSVTVPKGSNVQVG